MESKVIFSFLKRKIFLEIPVLAKINPREILQAWPFVKINPIKIFPGRYSRKLIHAKINPRKIFHNVFRKKRFGSGNEHICYFGITNPEATFVTQTCGCQTVTHLILFLYFKFNPQGKSQKTYKGRNKVTIIINEGSVQELTRSSDAVTLYIRNRSVHSNV